MLILLPNLLDESLDHEPFLPSTIHSAVSSLQGLFVESEKSARRYLRRFLSHDEMAALPLRPLNEHTKQNELEELLEPVARGETWGILSDAGLPCIADPGAELVALARQKGLPVRAIPGPSSLLLALQLSGLGGQRFAFHGYLPRESPSLEHKIRELEKRSSQEDSTQLFIEAPYRSAKLLEILIATLMPETRLSLAASLTTPQERVVVQTVGRWKQQKIELGKEPAVFLLHAALPKPPLKR